MNNPGRVLSSPLNRQRGFVFKLIHSLIIVSLVVGAVVLYKKGKLPFVNYRPSLSHWTPARPPAQPSLPPDTWTAEEPASRYIQTTRRRTQPAARDTTVAREWEDTVYTTGRYAVQVAAGYDSRQLYAWRDALVRDGFQAYVVSLNTSKGLQFKLRVGAYTSRQQAEKTRDRIKNRYPAQGLFADSFVITGE